MLTKPNPFLKAVEHEQLKLLSELEGQNTDDPDYKTKLDHIVTLNSVKPTEKDYTPIIVALIGASASIGGIGFVLNYERTGAVISKAFGLVKKA